MSKKTINVLLIEDTTVQARTVKHLLSSSKHIHFEITWCTTLADGLRHMATAETDVVLCDLQLHDSYGVGTLHRLQNQSGNVAVVLLTNLEDDMLKYEALSSGAQDYLIKSRIDALRLIDVLDHSIERHRLFVEMRNAYEARIDELENHG